MFLLTSRFCFRLLLHNRYGFVIYGLNYKSMLAYGRMDILFVALTDLATKRRSSGVYLSAVESDTIIITLLTDYHL